MKRRVVAADPTTDFARAVSAGRVPAGPVLRLACERHLEDLEAGRFVFDQVQADRAITFYQVFVSDGDRPFVPLPWQQFLIGTLHGWRTKRGRRRWGTVMDALLPLAHRAARTCMWGRTSET